MPTSKDGWPLYGEFTFDSIHEEKLYIIRVPSPLNPYARYASDSFWKWLTTQKYHDRTCDESNDKTWILLSYDDFYDFMALR
jgi:hypothetical protein